MSRIDRQTIPVNNNVTHIVVKNDLCIGCGLCAGVCPSKSLSMQWSSRGELIPKKINNCLQSCDLCLQICPFSGYGVNQDYLAEDTFCRSPDIKYRFETGYYLECYAGYSVRNGQRLQGASGGMATWFLETLIERNLVDAAVCVVPDTSLQSDRLFRFSIISEIEDVRAAARSKYYPVEISKVIQAILYNEKDRRYAIIGLPCLMFGLKLAMRHLPRIRRQIPFTLALTCGQLPNRYYTEFLSLKSGVTVDSLHSVDYRIKKGTTNPGNFAFCAKKLDGTAGKRIHWSPTPWHLWQHHYFIHNACNYCDDVFGETADIVFMDAWLSEYMADTKGQSLLIARTQESKEILELGIRDGTCHLEHISIEKILQSQGAIFNKKHLIKGRLYRAKKINLWVPLKRVLSNAKIYYKNIDRILLNAKVMAESKRLWPQFRNDDNTNRFMDAMAQWENYIRLLEFKKIIVNKLIKLLKDPFGVLRRALFRLFK